MRKNIAPIICALSLSLVFACQQEPIPNQSLSSYSQIQIQGIVNWESEFKTQATLSEIQPQATVSLLYPSDHGTLPNRTIATGLTNSNGEFIINPSENFTPSTGTVFVLEASKRVGGPGNSLLSLRTFLRWNGTNWSSITGPTIQLNALTTAIAIMSHNDSSISSLSTITSAPEGAIPNMLGNASASDIEAVRDLVNQTLTDNQDPNYFIERDGSAYRSKASLSTVTTNGFNGKVYDDTNAPLDGVTVTAKSLNSSVSYEVSTTTAGGTYAFNNAPVGVQIEITASRPGYATRRRVEVINENTQNNPNINRYDFGVDGVNNGFGTPFNALSDKPEVTMVTPGRNSSGINPGTSFVLKFSEPMDRQTVVDAFEIRAFGTDEELSVDSATTFNAGTAANGQLMDSGDLVWDKSAFNANWNIDDTEVTLTFKEERALPTDTNSNNVPDYSVSFEAGNAGLKDKSGVTRNERHFKLTDGAFEDYYRFSINTDTNKPGVDSIIVIDGGNSGLSNGDTIKVRFSERMIHRTLSGPVAGGINGQFNEAAGAVSGNNGFVSSADAAANYVVGINGNSLFDWDEAGGGEGLAVFDSNDPTSKTVLLFTRFSSDDVFDPGDNIEVTVKTTVLDPAGNSVDSNDSDASAVAG